MCAKRAETNPKKEVLTMKSWQRYLILTGTAMSQTLSHQDIKQAIEILR